MSARPILKPELYGVYDEGPLVKLQVGNSILPMTWDVAIRMGACLRVEVRNAQEFRGQERTIEAATGTNEGGDTRKAIREHDVLVEGFYKVTHQDADVLIVLTGGSGAVLTLTPEVARNISRWLHVSGKKVQEKYFPDMALRFHKAQLRDGVAAEKAAQSRRDATIALP